MHGSKLKEKPGRQELFRLASCPRMCSWELPLVVSSITPEQRLTYLLKSVTLTMSGNAVRALSCEDIVNERYGTAGIDLVRNILTALERHDGRYGEKYLSNKCVIHSPD